MAGVIQQGVGYTPGGYTSGITVAATVLPQKLRSQQCTSISCVRFELKFIQTNGKIGQGMVKYVGALPGRGEIYYGLELRFRGIRFPCTFAQIKD